jgi:anti-sigma B factor antagonist
MSDLSLDATEKRRSVVITAVGEVDVASAAELERYIRDYVDRDVTVDLNGVTFMDSSGITVLVRVQRLVIDAGHMLRVTGERANVRRVLEIAGLYDALHGTDAEVPGPEADHATESSESPQSTAPAGRTGPKRWPSP